MKMLPEYSFLEEVLHVKPNSRVTRKATISRERFALVTPFLDKWAVPEREALDPYLCVVRFKVPHSAGEVLRSLEGKPFKAADLGRLLDLCRAHPQRQFGYWVAFLDTSWYLGLDVGYTAYPCLAETTDGARILGSVLNRRRLKAEWHFALQPTDGEVAELLQKLVEEQWCFLKEPCVFA